MTPAIDTKIVTAHIPLPLAEKVELLATHLKCSTAWIIKQALTSWVNQEEQQSILTKEALEDVNAGRVVDHQNVQTWINSLSDNLNLQP